MGFRAQVRRIAFIDSRLRHKKDYPSCQMLAKEYFNESGDRFSTKTFQRDIDMMREEHQAPIEYDQYRHGFYYSDDTYRLPAMQLTEGDLLAVLVADRALSAYRNSPFFEKLNRIFGRLKELLPERVTVHASDAASNISIISEPVTSIDDRIWQVIQKGMNNGITVAIQYQSPGYEDSVERIIDPYHIVGHKGEWYILGWSHRYNEVRIFAMSRIKSAILSGSKFEHPHDFSPADYIDPDFGVFTKEKTTEISIRFSPEAAPYIKEKTWHPDQQIEDEKDGSIILKFTSNQQSQTLYWVSGWGPYAEVLSPESLRQKTAEWHRQAAQRYVK